MAVAETFPIKTMQGHAAQWRTDNQVIGKQQQTKVLIKQLETQLSSRALA